MLRRLRIENLVLIREAQLELGPGLVALTGETGAGKTMLAHALDLLLGGRARSGIVRPESVAAAMRPRETLLASVMVASNEVGTLQLVEDICSVCHEHGVLFHTAAVQALGQLYGLVQRQAAMLAVADTFWVLALVFLSMIPLVVCLRMTPLHKGPMMME